jgi:hypothetical protein
LASKVLPTFPTEFSPGSSIRIRGCLSEELAVHAVFEIWRHPFGEMVAQLAVCRIPKDRDAVFAARTLDYRSCGGGRARCEGYSGGDGTIQFVEVFAVMMYEFRIILINSTMLE